MKSRFLIMALLLNISTAGADNYPTTSYELTSGGSLKRWTGPETEIDLTADTYLRKAVEDIGWYAFDGNETVKHIKLSSTVDHVGTYAFHNCPNLETVTFDASGNKNDLSIQMDAFSHCPKLSSVSFSQYVTDMDGEIFEDCPSLVTLTVNSNNPNYCSSNNIIYNKTYDHLVIFPQGVTGHYDLGSRVVEIDEYAFNYSRLSSIYLSENLTKIGYGAFYRARNLKTVVFPPSLREIGKIAFLSCESLKSLSLPSSLESIGDRAFGRCTSLPETVKLPVSLVSIENGIFGGSTSVKRIEIPEGNPFFSTVDGALYNYAGDELIDWPNGKMENNHVIVPEGTRVIGEVAFFAAPMKTITLPSTLQEIQEDAFWMSGLEEVSVPEGVISLESFSFGGCDSLRVIELPSTLTNLDEYAFHRYDTRVHRRVISHAESPVGKWDDKALANDTLYVPKESLDYYSIAPTWRDFGTIKAIPEVQKFPVTFSYTGDGLIFVKIGEDEIESGAEVVEGTELTIVAFPFTDNEVGSLLVNGVECKDKNTLSDSETVQITLNVTEPVDIIGTFVSSIEDAIYQPVQNISRSSYFTLDGRKLDGVPTKKGIYMVNGHKYVKK